MGIRLLQLSVTNNKFCLIVETGIKISQFQNLFFDFSRLEIKKECNDGNDIISTVSSYEAVDVDDEFKIIKLFISEEVVEEEKIMFIVKHAIRIITSDKVEKIAGREGYQEGIFLLEEGDSITVTMACEKATFTAVRVNKKMYLLKEYPEYL